VSVSVMRRLALLVTISACLRAQPTADVDKAAIQHAKSVTASSLDGRLPKVTLEFLLDYEAGGAAVTWRVCDYPELTERASPGSNIEPLIYVEASFDPNDRTSVSVVISLGKPNAETPSNPVLVRATVREMGAPFRTVHRLGDLPMELHRPKMRLPQELPLQVGVLQISQEGEGIGR